MSKTVFFYPRMYGHMTLRPKNQILSVDDQIVPIPNYARDIEESQEMNTGLENENTAQNSEIQTSRISETDSILFLEDDYEKPECSICLEQISEDEGSSLDCQGRHRFHFGCFLQWKDECPLCRQSAQMLNVSDEMVYNYTEKLLSEDEEIFRQMSHLFSNYSEEGGTTKDKWLNRIQISTETTIRNVEAFYQHNPPTQVTYILQRYRQKRHQTIDLIANERDDPYKASEAVKLVNFQKEIRQ